MTSQALNRPVGQTVSAKRAIHAYIEHGAHPDPMVRDQAKREADKAVLRVVRNEPEQPEPALFCAIPTPGEDGEPQVMSWVGSTPVLIIVALACVAWVAYLWSAV